MPDDILDDDAPRTYSEHARQSLLDEVHRVSAELVRVSGPIVRADLSQLGEHIAQVERIANSFLRKVRSLQ